MTASASRLPAATPMVPTPPPHLRARVTGVEDASIFRMFGRRIGGELRALCKTAGVPLGAPGQRILDFGCGCGRVLGDLLSEAPQAHFHGVDVDAEAVEWCREHLGGAAEFTTTGRRPPLPVPDGSLDLIYGVSVFSHIPEEDQQAWLAEFTRVLAPGGTLLLSINGATVAQMATEPVRTALDADGIAYVRDGGVPGLPDWYQMCFHTREHVERTWPMPGLTLLSYVPTSVMMCQDAVLLRREAGEGGRE